MQRKEVVNIKSGTGNDRCFTMCCILCMHGSHVVYMCSLILRPPQQLSSFAIQLTLRRPGGNYLMTYASVYITHASLIPVRMVSWERDRNYPAMPTISIDSTQKATIYVKHD